jgi:hypothetical protein
MRKLFLQVVLLTGLAVLPMLANADRDDQRRQGWNSIDALQWRQGNSRGWQGYEIYYRAPGDRQWHRAPGLAHDLGAGWVIGTDRRNGGYGIYRWNGRNWQRMPGAGIEIGGSYNSPWVINDRGERFAWNGFDWRRDSSYRRNDGGGRDERNAWDRNRDDNRRDQGWNQRDYGRDGGNRR